MCKKEGFSVFRIILAVLVAVMIVGALLYFVPESTPVELNLDAVKLDGDGNELGTATISITGNRKDYLLQDDLLNVSISPFDGFPWFKLSEDGISGKKGVIREHYIEDCMQVMCYSTHSSTGDIIFCNLIFSENFEYIALQCEMTEGSVTYVASASGTHSTQEIIQYFRGLFPGYQS